MSRLIKNRQLRLDKVKQLKKIGINPYPARSNKEYSNQEVVDNFSTHEGKTVTLTGRIISWREHGHLVFAHIQDQSGKIQLFIHDETLNPTNVKQQTLGFDDLKLLDVGDFIQVTGSIVKTKTGEVSIKPEQIKLLAKAIRPLPSKWSGFKNPETIFRRRYLDLVMNRNHKQMFERKAKFWQLQRDFLQDRGFMQVEVPVLEHVTGGADARPFVTHMNALDQDFYLRISTELNQKRLIGGGYEKIYTLGPNFRNEGMSDEHLPEYHQLEWYWAYADYTDTMQLVKEMLQTIAQQLYNTTTFTKGHHTFNLADDWEQIDYTLIIKQKLDVDIFADSDDKMKQILKEHKISLDGLITRNRLIDNLWKIIRKTIAGPAFLINEPAFMSPLAKAKPDNQAITERFHIIIAGSELGNGYTEINDPIDQYQRFLDQQADREAGDAEAQMLDIDYVEMLEYGMPPTSGYGHSERIFWFLEDVTAREGTLFPHMRPKVSNTTKKIYNLTE